MRIRLSLMMFLQYAVPGAVLPLYSVHLQELGFSPQAIALCCATQAIAGMVATLWAGQIADRWLPAQRLMAAASFVAAGDLWLLADLRSPEAIFPATLLFWLMCSPILMLGTTIAFTHLPDPARQFGPVRLWGTVGWMTATWLLTLGISVDRLEQGELGIPAVFRIGAVIAVVLGVYALTLPHTPPARHLAGPAPLAALRLLRGWPFTIYAFVLFGICITFPFTTQGTPLLLRQLGIPDAWLAPTLSLAQASEIVCIGLLPMFLLRYGTRGTMLLGLGAWLTLMCILAIGRPVALIAGSLTLSGLCISGYFVAGQVFLNHQATGGLRASVQGLLSCVNATGMLLGNLLVGWLRDRSGGSLQSTFAVGAILNAALLLVFLVGFHAEES